MLRRSHFASTPRGASSGMRHSPANTEILDPNAKSNGSGPKSKRARKTNQKVGKQGSKSSGGEQSGASDSEVDEDPADSAELDEENEEDFETPEAFAPSDSAIKRNGSQVGLNKPGEKEPRFATPNLDSNKDLGDDDGSTSRGTSQGDIFADSSNDEDYNAVDLISDSEQEDPLLEKLEERIIIDSEEENETNLSSKTTTAAPAGASSNSLQEFDFDSSYDFSDLPFFDEQIRRSDPIKLTNEVDFFNPIGMPFSNDRLPSPPPTRQRRVRFDDHVKYSHGDMDIGSSDDDQRDFTDLFLAQDDLDPSFRALIEKEHNSEVGQSIADSNFSFCDFVSNDELSQHEIKDYDGPSSSSGSSSGYETDEGETTDEEMIPPATITRPQTLLRRSSAQEMAPPAPPPLQTRKGTTSLNSRRSGPYMGSWVTDPTKPIAILDRTAKHMVIYPALRPPKSDKNYSALASSGSSTADTSPRPSFANIANVLDDSENDRSDNSSHDFLNPMLTPNLMMAGLYNGSQDSSAQSGQRSGPPEVFYAFETVGPYAMSNAEEDDDDDGESQLNVEDFLDFGNDTSDSDGQADASGSANDGKASSLVKANASGLANTPGQSHLDHLSPGAVTAFRRHQHRHQGLINNQPIEKSFRSGTQLGTEYKLKPRKRKASDDIDRTTNSPFGVAARRRLSTSHKRIKSI